MDEAGKQILEIIRRIFKILLERVRSSFVRVFRVCGIGPTRSVGFHHRLDTPPAYAITCTIGTWQDLLFSDKNLLLSATEPRVAWVHRR